MIEVIEALCIFRQFNLPDRTFQTKEVKTTLRIKGPLQSMMENQAKTNVLGN